MLYTVHHDYYSSYCDKWELGRLSAGAVVELTEAQAAALNTDSAGVVVPHVKPAPTPPPAPAPEPARAAAAPSRTRHVARASTRAAAAADDAVGGSDDADAEDAD